MIAGIDLSTKSIALGFIDDISCCTLEIIQEGHYAEDRFDGLMHQFKSAFEKLDIEQVYIEAIPFMKSAKAALDLSSVCGGIRAVCVDLDIPYFMINNMSWKKGIGQKGRVVKEQTQQLMIDTYNIDTSIWKLSENAYDAMGVSTYGYKQCNSSRYSGDGDSNIKDNLLVSPTQIFLGATTIKSSPEKTSTKDSV